MKKELRSTCRLCKTKRQRKFLIPVTTGKGMAKLSGRGLAWKCKKCPTLKVVK